MSSCLSNGVLDNYHHLGDISAITDGLHYDPSLKPYQKSADGKSSGTNDDLWAFTTRSPMLDSRAANMFAAAAKSLRGFDDALADRALVQSKRLMAESEEMLKNRPQRDRGQSGTHDELSMRGLANVATNLQLFNATGEQKYKDAFDETIWKALDASVTASIQTALDALPIETAEYKEKLRPYVVQYKAYLDSISNENPYGVPIGLGNWAGSGAVTSYGTAVCAAHSAYPDIVTKDYIYAAANYLFGCHPYHNYSLVAAVGASRPKAVYYGNNRADFSFIPGNVAPGILFRHPDHFENYDQWPFLWGQNEGTIAGNCAYLIFAQAFKELAK